MRVFSILMSRRTTALIVFTGFALFTAIMSPYFSATAQEAADAPQVPNAYRTPYDFTGDGRSDWANLDTATAGSPLTWKILGNPAPAAPGAAFIRIFNFGLNGDTMAVGDYIGDGKSDITVYRPPATAGAQAVTYIAPFPEGTGAIGPVTSVPFGTTSDNPGRVGDYDGDGKDDVVIVRVVANILQWHIRGSAGTNRTVPFGRAVAGFSTLAFMGADFNNDGRDDLVMANASTTTGGNTWLIGDSITGNVILTVSFGNFITDYFLSPDDYTGDGQADLVVYRGGGTPAADGGFWYIRNTASGAVTGVRFGVPDPAFTTEDVPVRGNFDGDNMADICVFRRSNATYYWISSQVGAVNSQPWGVAGSATELPLGAFFNF